jgi:hypothetical protein
MANVILSKYNLPQRSTYCLIRHPDCGIFLYTLQMENGHQVSKSHQGHIIFHLDWINTLHRTISTRAKLAGYIVQIGDLLLVSTF